MLFNFTSSNSENMPTKKKVAKEEPKPVTHENVRIPVAIMRQVREFCESKRIILGGFFELAALEKLEREKSTNHE
jgi:hypothetical protein